jgi:diaminopimelate epimerase
MEKISFTKMSGAGNDFIILQDYPGNPAPVLIQKMCDRRNGIGADGLIIVKKSADADFAMQYYNSDGLPGSLCGNGARCALKFAFENDISGKNKMEFLSGSELFSGEILDEGIKFNLKPPEKIKRNFDIGIRDQQLKISFADTGSPHAIIYTDEVSGYFGTKYSLDEIPVNSLGKEIRYNEYFSPGGTNVNFLQVTGGKIYIRTFERGVEDETLACGTGSVAAAITSFLEGLVKPPVFIITRSKEELEVNFSFKNEQFSDVSLTGPAKIIFTGEYRN